MIVRIVKMGFHENSVDAFLKNYEANKFQIRGFNGCNFLELYRDKHNPTVFFTYSYWDSEEDLNNYRNSDYFKKVWSSTKILFNDKPEAWSVNRLHKS